MKPLFLALSLAVFSTATAHASILNIVFDQPDQIALPGQTLQFFAVITSTTSDEADLDGDNFDLAAANLNVIDDFANTPLSLTGVGTSSGDVEVFDVSVNQLFTGTYGSPFPGNYQILGGPGGNTVIGSANFSVTVVPEPASLYLLLGVAAAGLFFRTKLRLYLAKR